MKFYSRFAIITALLAAISVPALASSGLELLQSVYDFGLFREAAGPQTCVVKMVNRGTEPDFIRSVHASCGCTDVTFQEGEIAPGDTCNVTVTYDPAGRPGKFNKNVRVTLGEDYRQANFKIVGTVLGTPETLDVAYPVAFGNLRLGTSMLYFDGIAFGNAKHQFINAVNMGETPLKLTLKSSAKELDAGVFPEVSKPGDVITFSFYLNSHLAPGPGEYNYTVEVLDADRPDTPIGEIKIGAKIEPKK